MLPAHWHRYIFLLGLFGLAAGMLFGAVPMSVPEIILFGNWVFEGRFREKWSLLKHNKIFWTLSALFLLHLIGLTYTHNMAQGFKDIFNKVPLAVLPLVFFSAKPLNRVQVRALFGVFLLSVFISSICCYIVYLGYTKKVVNDVRDASVFMSHIRYSLFIALAIACSAYYFTKVNRVIQAVLLALCAWLFFYLYKFEMATGFICLCIAAAILLSVYGYKRLGRRLGLLIPVLLAGLFVCAGLYIKKTACYFKADPYAPANVLLTRTYNGNSYLQDTAFHLAENGNRITINISDYELRKAWNTRSALSFDSLDKKKNELRFTILRYMSSKGLAKDSVGVSKLSDEDIRHIEGGITNYKYPLASGLESRWRELVWEYNVHQRGKNPSGHTMAMRLEFWRTAVYIIKKHPLIGVGTGDVQDEFNVAYNETGSSLDIRWRLRNHNQYLAITVAFGIVGLLLFLFYLVYPAATLYKHLHVLYWPFFIMALLSFVTEDTLETQSGVNFFIFYQAFFLWLAWNQKERSAPEARSRKVI